MGAEFHLFLPQMRMTHAGIVERARAAEAAGFTGVAFMDHLAPPMADDQDMWEAMSIAGWVLAHTTTLIAGHLAGTVDRRAPRLRWSALHVDRSATTTRADAAHPDHHRRNRSEDPCAR